MITPLLDELPPHPGTAITTTCARPSSIICLAGTSSFRASRFMRSMPMPSGPENIAMNAPWSSSGTYSRGTASSRNQAPPSVPAATNTATQRCRMSTRKTLM